MTTVPSPESPVRSAAELTARWAGLLEPPVFRRRSLWLAWVAPDGLMLPLVLPVDDVPPVPDRLLLSGLLDLHEAICEQGLPRGSHLAMALCRPGAPAMRLDDAEWVDALHDVLDGAAEGTWSLHLAAGGAVTELVGPPEGPLAR
ncbi:hypothetical protein ACI797_14400 [Geodermatophilus sp. SYSU D00691]